MRVVIVDDQVDILTLLEIHLAQEPGIELVAQARDGREAVELARSCAPDVMVLDGSMPVVDGLTAIPQVLEAAPACRIVFFSSLGPDAAEEALRSGASAALSKTDGFRAVVHEVLATKV